MPRHKMREYLNGYLDNELSAETRKSVEEHLTTCESCRRELDELNALHHHARHWSVDMPETDYWDGLAHSTMIRIKKEQHFRDIPVRARFSWQRLLPVTAAAAAAVIVGFVGLEMLQNRLRSRAESKTVMLLSEKYAPSAQGRARGQEETPSPVADDEKRREGLAAPRRDGVAAGEIPRPVVFGRREGPGGLYATKAGPGAAAGSGEAGLVGRSVEGQTTGSPAGGAETSRAASGGGQSGLGQASGGQSPAVRRVENKPGEPAAPATVTADQSREKEAVPTGQTELGASQSQSTAPAEADVLPVLKKGDEEAFAAKSFDDQAAQVAVIKALVEANGKVSRVALVKSSGSDSLDRLAARRAATYLFTPALKNGKPVRAWTTVPVRFAQAEK